MHRHSFMTLTLGQSKPWGPKSLQFTVVRSRDSVIILEVEDIQGGGD